LNAGRPQDFQVLVHDPADVTINSGNVPGINPVTGTLNSSEPNRCAHSLGLDRW